MQHGQAQGAKKLQWLSKNYEFLSWIAPFLRLKTTDDNLLIYIMQQTNEMEESDNSSSDLIGLG